MKLLISILAPLVMGSCATVADPVAECKARQLEVFMFRRNHPEVKDPSHMIILCPGDEISL